MLELIISFLLAVIVLLVYATIVLGLPIIFTILIIKGLEIGWVFLLIWFIGFTVINVCKEVKNDKNNK